MYCHLSILWHSKFFEVSRWPFRTSETLPVQQQVDLPASYLNGKVPCINWYTESYFFSCQHSSCYPWHIDNYLMTIKKRKFFFVFFLFYKKHFGVLLLHVFLEGIGTLAQMRRVLKNANLLFWVKAYKILMDYFLQGNVSLRWYLLNAKHPIEPI